MDSLLRDPGFTSHFSASHIHLPSPHMDRSMNGKERSGFTSESTTNGKERSQIISERASAQELDSELWHACAGSMVNLPQVGTKVIYFPQGHAEHASSTLLDFPPTATCATYLCRVLSIHFLADTETDEVYARIRLQPLLGNLSNTEEGSPPSSPCTKPSSFAKTLTQSDANNGGGFSVPRYCAETIFPRLDYTADPPVQIVLAKDVHGAVWRFRHIYRGTPRRHLLTTGWSNFVNQKKLVAGDAIVFLRSTQGELCVGIRRSSRGTIGGAPGELSPAQSSLLPSSKWKLKTSDDSLDMFPNDASGGPLMHSFTRNRARVTIKDVVESAKLAAAGLPFEVVYYPRSSISQFCVKANEVQAALQQNWAPGMRFKMPVETEDASRISWFMGTISKVQDADPIRWPRSPWKMLQVTWDEPDVLQGFGRVSPWQVELISPVQILPFPSPFSLPRKKARLSQAPELQVDGHVARGFFSDSPSTPFLGYENPWHGSADSLSVTSAGMQGARHDRTYPFTFPNAQTNYSNQRFFLDMCASEEHPVIHRTPTNKKSSEEHLSDQSDLCTQLTVGSSSKEPVSSNNDCSSSVKKASFRLFGKAIDTSQSVGSEHSGGSSSDGTCEGFSPVNKTTSADTVHAFLSCNRKRSIEQNMQFVQGGSFNPAQNEVGTLNWFKEQAKALDLQKTIIGIDNTFELCNVSRENDKDSYRLDLLMFGSYEELYDRLSKMFGIQKSELLHRVVCVDSMGSCGRIGEESYMDFTKRTKCLKILSEYSCESITK